MRRYSRKLWLESLCDRNLLAGDLVAEATLVDDSVDKELVNDQSGATAGDDSGDDDSDDDSKPDFNVHCFSDVACESLKTWCGKNGGSYIDLDPQIGLCTTYVDTLEVPDQDGKLLARSTQPRTGDFERDFVFLLEWEKETLAAADDWAELEEIFTGSSTVFISGGRNTQHNEPTSSNRLQVFGGSAEELHDLVLHDAMRNAE